MKINMKKVGKAMDIICLILWICFLIQSFITNDIEVLRSTAISGSVMGIILMAEYLLDINSKQK